MRNFNPAINRRYLILIAGILWSIVGAMLFRLAVHWLSEADGLTAAGLASAGILLSLVINRTGFSKIVDSNIDRILSMKEQVCIFGFQPWKSYLIIVVMIGMGIALRSSSLSKAYLSVIYIGFGGAMVLSSLKYYREFFQISKKS